MIRLKCVYAFGNFKPGDLVMIPAGAAFDRMHFAEVDGEGVPLPQPPPETRTVEEIADAELASVKKPALAKTRKTEKGGAQ